MSPISFRRKTIRSDKTLGEKLEAARTERKLSLDDAEASTHVRCKHLAALEQGRFDALPEDVYTAGFVRRYASFLGLDPEVALTEYRCERIAAQRLGRSNTVAERGHKLRVAQPIREIKWIVTPKLFWFAASVLVIAGIAGYIWYQVHGFMSAPNLDLAQLEPEMIVSTPSISIEGSTDGYAFVTINAEPVAIDPSGKFQQEVRLEPGINTIEVAARNRLNKETKRQIRVMATYDAQSTN